MTSILRVPAGVDEFFSPYHTTAMESFSHVLENVVYDFRTKSRHTTKRRRGIEIVYTKCSLFFTPLRVFSLLFVFHRSITRLDVYVEEITQKIATFIHTHHRNCTKKNAFLKLAEERSSNNKRFCLSLFTLSGLEVFFFIFFIIFHNTNFEFSRAPHVRESRYEFGGTRKNRPIPEQQRAIAHCCF